MSESILKPFTKAEMDAMRGTSGDPETMDAAGPTPEETTLLARVWDKVRRVGRRLPFAEDVLAAYFCVLDPVTPRRVRFVLIGALAYFVLPTDAIADFLPIIGFTDDAAVLAAAIAGVASSIRPEHREQAREALQQV
ncbi:YkvA family protein [Salinarimonas soli]|uniref:DUF1232 domain-containing protein n=1 Tax=Salinarimonas soli TaxID=1638099 RepID=A0A5B2VHK6_9HYPH|nr:YkvA family protein [Salinarimonas soli]KAA2237832.1 DUF1232 domain-containing protein [Salinarimonas soli]